MATFTSKNTGGWDAEGQTTWNEPGHPVAGDTVTINEGHTVTLQSATACTTLTISATGVLNTSAAGNYSLTVSGATSVTGTLTCNASAVSLGTLAVNASATMNATSATMTITGTGASTLIVNSTGIYNNNLGTVAFVPGSAADQVINMGGVGANHTLYNVTKSGLAGYILLASDTKIDGNLTITSSGTITLGLCSSSGTNSDLTVVGDVTLGGSGSGSARLSHPTTAFKNPEIVINGILTINTLGILYLLTSLTVTGKTSISGGTITGAGATVVHSDLVTNTGTYTISTGSTTFTAGMTSSGTVTIGNGSSISGSASLPCLCKTAGTWTWNNCTLSNVTVKGTHTGATTYTITGANTVWLGYASWTSLKFDVDGCTSNWHGGGTVTSCVNASTTATIEAKGSVDGTGNTGVGAYGWKFYWGALNCG